MFGFVYRAPAAGRRTMTNNQIADCPSRMHEHCDYQPRNKRKFDYCENAIKFDKCPRGYKAGEP
jgi:hypothetical protein